MTIKQTIDDKINNIMPTENKPDDEYKKEPEAEIVEPKAEVKQDEAEDEAPEKESHASQSETIPDKSDETKAETQESAEDKDEYGNKVSKGRTYTEEEVNRMMRERFSRGHYAQQATPAEVTQAAQNFTPDPNSEDDWQVQLDAYIDKRLETREKTIKQQEWQRAEQEKQAAFQDKFTLGMDKYTDFRETVSKLPITDSMMMATREMKDPAAFVYAAAKMHPEEVKRIAGLTDPYHQAAEIGRLEERMRKSARISKAATPLSPTKGDATNLNKVQPKRSIDSLIASHAKTRARSG